MGECSRRFEFYSVSENSTPSFGVPIAIGISNDIDSWGCFSSMLLIIRRKSGLFFRVATKKRAKKTFCFGPFYFAVRLEICHPLNGFTVAQFGPLSLPVPGTLASKILLLLVESSLIVFKLISVKGIFNLRLQPESF